MIRVLSIFVAAALVGSGCAKEIESAPNATTAVQSAAPAITAPLSNITPVVVLVPGFLNSMAVGYARPIRGGIEVQPYFSRTIIETVESHGYPTVVVNNLLPTAPIHVNGELLLDFLEDLRRDPNFADRPMILIAHSAGGLYSMYALTKDPTLPVTALATISTPYDGVKLVETIRDHAPILEALARFIRLESLIEFQPEIVKAFLKTVRLPVNLRLVVSGGVQRPCFLFNCAKAERLSWPLSMTQQLVREPSDGLITEASSYARDIRFPTTSGTEARVERAPAVRIDLEHWEQVTDGRAFMLLGVVNPGFIDRTQRHFFSTLLDYLKHPAAEPPVIR